MAEEVTGQAAQPETNDPQGAEVEVPTIESLQAELAKAKSESRKWEKRAKENKDAADKLSALEAEKDTSKTDVEKATAKAEKAIAELEAMKEEKRRSDSVKEIAKSKGVDAELLSLMAGSTDEEIEANADILKSKFDAKPKYPDVNDGGTAKTPQLTKEEILKIKNPNERFKAIAQNASLFRK